MGSTFVNNDAVENGRAQSTEYTAINKRSNNSDWEPKRVGRRRTIIISLLTLLAGAVIGAGIMAILFTQSLTVKKDLCSPLTLEQTVTTPKISVSVAFTQATKRDKIYTERLPTETTTDYYTTLPEFTTHGISPSNTEVQDSGYATRMDNMSSLAYTSTHLTNASVATTPTSHSTAFTTTKLKPETALASTSSSKTDVQEETTSVHIDTTAPTTTKTTTATTLATTATTAIESTTEEDTTAQTTAESLESTAFMETTEIDTTAMAETTTVTTIPTTTTPEVTELPTVTTESEVTTGNPIPNGCDVEYERKCFRAVISNQLNVHWNESKILCDLEGWKLANIYSLSHFYMMVGYLRQNFPKSGYISAWTGMRMIPQDLQIVLSTGKNITLWNIKWNKDYPSKHPSDTRMGIDLIMLPSRESILSQGLWNYDPSWNGNAAICEEEY